MELFEFRNYWFENCYNNSFKSYYFAVINHLIIKLVTINYIKRASISLILLNI